MNDRLWYGAGLTLGTLIRVWRRTIRLEARNRHVLDAPAVLAFWHGRIVGLLMDRLGCGAVAMASRSGDGALAAGALVATGVRVARGSPAKGGREALGEMERIVREGAPFAALTVDGPRGPWRRVKPGTVVLARRLGVPVVPGTFSCRRASLLRSWDRAVLPRPFTRVVAVYGDPIELGDLPDDVEEAAAMIGDRIDAMTAALDREIAGRELWPAP